MRALWILFLMAASIGAIVGVYFYALRPLLIRHPKYAAWIDLADTRGGRAFAWLKLRAAETAAGLAFVLPEVPDLVTELTGIDWTSISPSPFWAAVSRALGIAAIGVRFFMLRKKFGGD